MIEIKGITFNVDIRRKRIKNLYLRLEDNTIVASAPYFIAEYEIYKFIESKRNWIYRVYDQQKYKQRVTHLYNGGDYFYIFYTPYRLHRTVGKKAVNIVGKEIYLSYPDESDQAIKYLYKYLDKYLLSKAHDYLNKHIGFLKDYGYNLVPEIKCRQMSSKWGVCYTRKNQIVISSYLIHYPFECIEYIMVHEMTHFLIPNHSKRFYEIVSNNMPDYKAANDKLKL